jgi:hypothetical protein
MVLDNTYSMNGTKIADLRTAATTLVDILYGSNETVPNLWVGLVPFVQSVNVGNNHADWLVQAPAGPPSFPHLADRATPCDSADDSHSTPDTDRCEQLLANPATYGWNGTHYGGTGNDPTLPFYHSSYYDGGQTFGPAGIGWKGCVEARIRPDDGSDHTALAENPPSVRAFRPYFYPESRFDSGNEDNPWTTGTTNGDGGSSNLGRTASGPNIGCGQAIQHLTESKTTITTAINAMTVWQFGGTAIKLGLAWGWRTLSPEWAGLWDGDPNKPLAYDAPLMDKAIILLTDGEHFFWNWWSSHDDGGYTSHGRIEWGRLKDADGNPANSASEGVAELDRRLGILCEAIKAKGIKIYTIMLELSSTSLEPLFRNCATKPEWYFESPSSSQLEGVFQKIANELAQLRVAE